MATKYFTGNAIAVAQISSGSIDSLDATPANNTFTVAIGGVSISQVGITDVSTTAAALVALLNASTHPYFAAITWTNPSSGNIVGTADTAGVPFTAALTETGAGSGSVTDFSDDTACTGPNFWDNADNWSTGAVPVNSDDIIFRDSSVNVCWGLDQSAVDLASLTIEQTYTGKIGLDLASFATSADGDTGSAAATEYRDDYLVIGWSACAIGEHFGPGQANGSGRLKLDNDLSGASTTVVHNTASTATETSRPPVRLLLGHASADLIVRSGSVGVAVGEPGETATVGDVIVHQRSARCFLGEGVTLTNFTQYDGYSVLQAAATVTSVTVHGGTVVTEGDFTVTTLTVNGGTVNCNHVKTAGNAVTTLNQSGGTVDATGSSEARTWATVNLDGGTLKADDAVLTITTLDQPAGVTSMSVT